MGLLDETIANAQGNFNAAGRGARAGNTTYFGDSFTPGLSDISEEFLPETGVMPTRSESGFRGPQEPGRDLTQDPMTASEARMAQMARVGLGAMPFGTVLSAAADYGMGQDSGGNMNPRNLYTETPDTVAGRTGFWTGQGNDFATSLQASLARSGLGQAVGAGLPAGLKGAGLVGYFGKEYAGQGFNGLGNVGYDVNPVGFEAGVEPEIVENMPAPSDGSSSNYRANDAGGSGNTWRDQSGSVTTGGEDFADGGIVGLTGPRYADGGQVGPLLQMGFADGGGVGLGQPGGQMDANNVNAQVNRMLQNPQFKQKLIAGAQHLMQTGELTPQEVQVMGQIAEASMQNPALYPKLRMFVAQQGMSPLPPSYDPSVIVKILAISRALAQAGPGLAAPGGPGATPAGTVPPTNQAQMQNPNGMANGGYLQGPGTGRSDSIGTKNESTGQPVRVANGEYVIPEHVVRAKGRDFFDKMLRQYADVPKQGE